VTISAKPFAIVLLGLICGLVFFGQDLRVGVRIRVFDLGMVLIAVIFAWHVVSQGVARQTAAFVLIFGAYVVYVAANALLQSGTGVAITELLQLLLYGAFFLALAQYLDDVRALKVFLTVLLVTLWALALHNAGVHIADGSWAGWKSLGDQKLTHSMIVVVMSTMTVSKLRARGWLWIVLLVLAVVLLFLSGERKGWVATGLAVLAALVISDRGGIGSRAVQRTLWVVICTCAALALAAVLAPFVPYLEKQLFSSVDFATLLFSDEAGFGASQTTESNRNRLALIDIALQQFRENPVFGVGPDAFQSHARSSAFLAIDASQIASSPHNELLRIGAELGAVGLGLYLLAQTVLLGRAIGLISAMAHVDEGARLRIRLGFALLLYGFVINLFLAGGGLNTFFVMLPAGLLYSVRMPERARAPSLYDELKPYA